MITTGHLCSGYDGLGLALDNVEPHRALWHAEVDPYASQVLAREYPLVRNVGDLLGDFWDLAPAVDLVAAGFPCQPISVAGRQLAHNDPRWLWPGVLNVVRTVKPFRVFLENVQNIVSIQGGAILRLILDDLRAAGYASRWVVLGACAVGAPHHRHRWFLVADFVGTYGPDAVRIAPRALCGAPRSGGRVLLPSPMARDCKTPGIKRMERGEDPWDDLPTAVAPLPTPNARDGGDRGSPSRDHAARRAADPMRSLNLEDAAALLPTPRATDGPNGGPNQRNGRGEYDALPGCVVNMLPTPVVADTRGTRNATARRTEPGKANDGWTLSDVAYADTWGKYAAAVALWEQVTGIPAPVPTEPGSKLGRRLSPSLPEWMMGLEPGYLTKGTPRAQALKLAGNGVVPLQAAAAYRMLTA